eukprot:m.24613 g.24613  ORF g.24613 m.24613 type:complete len:106 (+) comp5676_c0_seq1:135-452(+)
MAKRNCCWCEFATSDLYLFYCHSWHGHRSFQLPLSDEATEEELVFFPCELCGKGSGVVFSTLGNLHDHLFEHLFDETISIPNHLELYAEDAQNILKEKKERKDSK